MAQLPDDWFALGSALTRLDEALRKLDERLTCVVGDEEAAFADCRNRLLAEDLVAPEDVPPHDNSAVDGFALRSADLRFGDETRMRVAGRAAAGHPFAGHWGEGEAVRIFTGAPMPDGCDTVMMQEDCAVDGDIVRLRPGIRPGANRRRAGEDFACR